MAPVYGYTLNNAFRSELMSHCSLETTVTELFKEYGFDVTAPLKLQGQSGIVHEFDLGASRDKTEIVMDLISATDEVGPQDIVTFFAKVYDSKPENAILVAMPKISSSAQKLGAMYNVEVISAEIPEEIIKKLTPMLGARPTFAQREKTEETASPSSESVPDSPKQETSELELPMTPKVDSLQTTGVAQATVEPEQLLSVTTRNAVEEVPSSDEILRVARSRMARMMEDVELRTSGR